VLRAKARQGANFNGPYRVASWVAERIASKWAVIDLESGKVWFPPEPAYSCWATVKPFVPGLPARSKGKLAEFLYPRMTMMTNFMTSMTSPIRKRQKISHR
jgi:hypothetical protein